MVLEMTAVSAGQVDTWECDHCHHRQAARAPSLPMLLHLLGSLSQLR
jgi:hypothetical protein